MQVLLTAFQLAVDSIRAHKLRSFLTLLGVIIGVASVILVGAAIDGMGSYAESSTAKVFGSDSYMVGQMIETGRSSRKERAAKLKRNKQIRREEVDWLRQTTGDQILYSPYQVRTEDIKADSNQLEGSSILGVSATLPEIRDVTLVDGRFFTEEEERTKQFVCVAGEDVRTFLFPASNPLGRTIKISGLDFRIVGMQEKLGSSFGRSQDNQVYIPTTVFTRMFGQRGSLLLFARAKPDRKMSIDDGIDVTRSSLRTRFRERPGEADKFEFMTPDSVRAFIDQILGIIAAVVVPVTSISLVVGGIVIMNIMLVSVTERTKEIGIRKSLGARQSDVMIQFLAESVILSGVGGLMGLGTGALVAQLLSIAVGTRLSVSLPYVLLAIVVSTTVGIVSGWYPARRAARMDPIEALRAD